MAAPGRQRAPGRASAERLKAVALRYERGRNQAPKVSAKGSGVLAERILAVARAHGIPVREDRLLVEALDALEVGQDVPPELYQVIAEILVAVHRAERDRS
jgi:flagellar biosynthesis protein